MQIETVGYPQGRMSCKFSDFFKPTKVINVWHRDKKYSRKIGHFLVIRKKEQISKSEISSKYKSRVNLRQNSVRGD